MSRRIVKFEVIPRALPVRVPFAISRETLDVARVVLVLLWDEAGSFGLGECAPFPSLTHDDAATAAAEAHALAAALVGLDVTAALARLDAAGREIAKRSVTARVGCETALLDLGARQSGQSFARLFGAAELRSVETDLTLPLMAPAAVSAFMGGFARFGFRTIKIKVKGEVENDRELVRALVRTVPRGTTITLDGNQGYRYGGAKRLLELLAADGTIPAFFEQPLPEDDWDGHARLSQATPVPICLDETVRTVFDCERAVREKTARIVNLKIMKSGVRAAAEIMRVAHAGGIELMIGGMLETEIAMTASLHLACGTGLVRYFDLDTPFFLEGSVTEENPWATDSAILMRPAGAGLGLTLRRG